MLLSERFPSPPLMYAPHSNQNPFLRYNRTNILSPSFLPIPPNRRRFSTCHNTSPPLSQTLSLQPNPSSNGRKTRSRARKSRIKTKITVFPPSTSSQTWFTRRIPQTWKTTKCCLSRWRGDGNAKKKVLTPRSKKL